MKFLCYCGSKDYEEQDFGTGHGYEVRKFIICLHCGLVFDWSKYWITGVEQVRDEITDSYRHSFNR